MPVNEKDYQRIKAKLEGLLTGMADDLQFAGENAATAIVQTTLAGIGDGDTPFAPYSPGYQAMIEAVGGKPGEVVNLRGLFYHDGQKKYRGKKNLGQKRRAYVGVAFASLEHGVRVFQARTEETRPQRGLTDKLSEMSLDLIGVEATDYSIKISYNPWGTPYMVWHNEGTGKAPQRKWFTLNKAAVKAAIFDTMKTAILARVQWFNSREMGRRP
jgi:hypothetical protein